MATDIAITISKLKTQFHDCLRVKDIQQANAVALEAADVLFALQDDHARQITWSEFYSQLAKRYRVQYQCYDFEVVDYDLYWVPDSWSLLRGPKPLASEMEGGRYVTFMGAAQLFGRYQAMSPPAMVCREIGLSAMNLSTGGAGPESFMREELAMLANGGQAAVLQILSGRSIGCEEYPGTRLTFEPGNPEHRIDRLKLLQNRWSESPAEAIRLVRKWQQRYVDAMKLFLSQIEVPVILVWMSTRSADDWSVDCLDARADFGAFPQLVDRAMVTELGLHCAGLVELTRDEGLPYGFVSRYTRRKCPVLRPNGNLLWQNGYYPSAAAGAQTASSLKLALEAVLRLPRSS